VTSWAAWLVVAPALVAVPLALWATSPARPSRARRQMLPAPVWAALGVVVVLTAPWWPWPWGHAPP
jgi:hypothetical protein